MEFGAHGGVLFNIMKRYIFLEKDKLLFLLERGDTIKNISKELHCSNSVIKYYLKFWSLNTNHQKKLKQNNITNVAGKIFGRLKVVSFSHSTKKGPYFKCLCECGKEKVIRGLSVLTGGTKSCGCLAKETLSKNGSLTGSKNLRNGTGRKWYFIKDNVRVPCRSGYEVLYANYLIDNNVNFEYEPKMFLLENSIRYTPDFYLPKENLYIEIKGYDYGKQIEKRKIFSEKYPLVLIKWDELKSLLKLPKRYNYYNRKAEQLKISPEDYLANKLYIKS